MPSSGFYGATGRYQRQPHRQSGWMPPHPICWLSTDETKSGTTKTNNTKMLRTMYVYVCPPVQQGRVLMIIHLIVKTIINAQMLSTGGRGHAPQMS